MTVDDTGRHDSDRDAQVAVPFPPHRTQRDMGDVRLAPSVPLTRSYGTQIIRIALDGGVVDLEPLTDTDTDTDTDALPLTTPSYLLSAWSPGGEPATLARNNQATGRLRRHLDAIAIGHRRAATFAPDRSWVEESLVVDDLTDAAAVALGRLLGQPAVVRLDSTGGMVLPTGLADVTPTALTGWTVRPAAPGCPMRRSGGRGEVCRNPGGPWVSRSMEVAAVWEQHRSLLAGQLGCTVCGDGSRPSDPRGRPVLLHDLYLPSRWGGWQFAQ